MSRRNVTIVLCCVVVCAGRCAASSNAMWTWVGGSSSAYEYGVYGTKGVADPNNVPGARVGAVSWIDDSDNLWLFGGQGFAASGYYDLLNDLWEFDGANWTWVSGSSSVGQPGVYGVKGVPDPDNVPGRELALSHG